MSAAVLRRLGLRRGLYLWACFRLPLVAELPDGEVEPSVHGEMTLLLGTEDDPSRPVLHVDTLDLVIDETEELGGPGGTPSVCLAPGSRPRLELDARSRRFGGSFEALVDFPALRRGDEERRADPATDTPGRTGLRTTVDLRGEFLTELRPVEFGLEMLQADVVIDLPAEVERLTRVPRLVLPLRPFPFTWFHVATKRRLTLQPVFIAADGRTPPTGADFYPGLQRANELWGRCCIDFVARCPVYVDEQRWRVATQSEAVDFKNSTNVSDAIEVFIVQELDPVDLWGGGATFASGTATAKVVSTDNQLPLNQNHMAHELGHVLGLGHPGDSTDTLADGCDGSLMEPSGFFADNPGLQCERNCTSASNPLLRLVPGQRCISVDRPDEALF